MSNDEKQQVYAFNLATAGHNFLISGQAGTGKTTLLVKLHDKLREIGKQVAVVCTTGIACASLPSRCDARTVHCWAGMDDGRYDTSYIKDIIINYKKDVYRNILSTDVLILDEVSMLSKKLFEQLECICSLKCGHKLFGGMQLVFCGDFYQLPPVKNRMYNDDGKFCFESELFDQVFPHRITLENVVRQSDSSFIKCVNEAAKGKLSESSVTLLESLKRPLCKDDNDEPIKLYATNEQVDNHNRLRILNKSGQLYEYKAIDRGESHYLKKVLAPPTLWLKDGCPVILVRNISSNLVNGLQGIVLSCKECPVVHFPTVDITTKLEKQIFSVFSPVLKKNVAERTQVPLKLAYALTVHKAQGMTLQRAEIDCHSMFAPGQLGVAIGRVKSPAGLRVINFKREICLPQPPIIEDAMKFCSAPDIDDCSCCRITRLVFIILLVITF
ncbi:hypothetical protein FSP39_008107 [Pinctada imbricata]|uniref:ATP-dependent DNA helicase n=1 Tax=Pinctada imbricata TaxID=66713 RepID=A0AA88XI27_PINIB|nr:hypothetical protein FSP39_008107 [Pinctada imbricata]